jgi:hypothetical protein
LYSPSFDAFLLGLSGGSPSVKKTSSLQAWEEVCKLLVSPSLQRKARKGASRIGTSLKLWKEKKVVKKMVLESDIGLGETCRLVLCSLVGIISYMYLCKVSLLVWVEQTWGLV